MANRFPEQRQRTSRAWYLLLLLPFIGLLWPPLYARVEPRLWGFPFFYWYQLLWVFIASGCTYLAYRLVHNARRGGDR